MKRPTIARGLITALILLLLFVVARLLPAERWGESVLVWIEARGALGPIVLAGAYVLPCIFFLPGLPLTLGAGFLFGLADGLLIATVGTAFGSTLSFLLGRTIARPWAVRYLGRFEKMRTLDRAVGHRELIVVILARLSPFFPYNLLNYGFAISRVSFRSFFLGSLIGVFPVTALNVYLGTLMKSLADIAAGRVDPGQVSPLFPVLTVVGTAGVVFFLGRLGSREIRRALEWEAASEGAEQTGGAA